MFRTPFIALGFALTLGLAEVSGANDVFIGVNALDYSGYPDCRPEFIDAFQKMAALATKAGVEGHPIRVNAPLQHMSKADIAREAQRLGKDFLAYVLKAAPDRDTRLEAMVGEIGVARTALDPAGMVFVHGELWNATARSQIAEGADRLLRLAPHGGIDVGAHVSRGRATRDPACCRAVRGLARPTGSAGGCASAVEQAAAATNAASR